jgi:hypothetical protein
MAEFKRDGYRLPKWMADLEPEFRWEHVLICLKDDEIVTPLNPETRSARRSTCSNPSRWRLHSDRSIAEIREMAE